MIASGVLNPGVLLTVLWSVNFGAFSLGSIGPRIETFAKAVAASQNLFQIIQRVPSINSADQEGEKPPDIRGSLELKGVSFVYPSRPEGNFLETACLTT